MCIEWGLGLVKHLLRRWSGKDVGEGGAGGGGGVEGSINGGSICLSRK